MMREDAERDMGACGGTLTYSSHADRCLTDLTAAQRVDPQGGYTAERWQLRGSCGGARTRGGRGQGRGGGI